jgi:polysaccharide biosynthesis protein PslH
MEILFVVPYVPNLIRVRPYNLIKHLAGRGHHITLVTVWSDKSERGDLENLKPYCHRLEAIHLNQIGSLWNCLLAVPTANPLQSAYSWSPKAAAKMAKMSGDLNIGHNFDVAHVEHLRGARYGLFLKQNLSGIPVVWDSVDCISLLFQQAAHQSTKRLNRWLTQFELKRTKHLERHLLKQFDRTVVTSHADREAFLTLNGELPEKMKPVVVPNGVDLSYFTMSDPENREAATLVISGKMSYHANISMVMHFVRNILPLIQASRPDVRVWIVGKDPPGDIVALGESAEVHVTGTVDDIRPYLQKATVALAPLPYGAGVQNKVLEAMACGTPVVASPKAVSALDTISGQHLLVAEDPVSFAEAVIGLLGDSSYRQFIGQGGRIYVEKYHHWEIIAARMEGIYNEVINNRN